jgi:hypothetical protein
LVNTIKYRRNLVKADFGIAVDLAKQLDFLFEKGTSDERQLLCETVFKRLSIKEGKIVKLELNPPFHLINEVSEGSQSFKFGSGGWIRTNDLRVMSPTSYHCSTPR